MRIPAVIRSSSTGPCSARSPTCSRRTPASSPCSATTTCSTITATRSSARSGQPARWWSATFGELLLVGLDSNPPVPTAQLEFLESTLAASTARWRVVALHHPPYSAGYQGSHLATRRLFAPIFARHRVQLVLSAHDHDYQRSRPIDGVTYLVTGGAAQARFTAARSFTAVSYRVRHFVEVAVFADRLVVRGIDQQGRVFDEVVVPERTSELMRDSGVNAS